MTPDELIALMRAGEGTESWTRWNWAAIVAALDNAGYAIVRKPVLREVGKPTPRPS